MPQSRRAEAARRSRYPSHATVRKLTKKIGFQEPDDTIEEYEARAALRAAEKLKYFIAPPDNTNTVKLFVAGPEDRENRINFSSPVFLDLLNPVRRRCRVWVNLEEAGPNSLTIEAVSLADLWTGHRSITDLVHGLNALSSNRVFAVQPLGGDNIGPSLSIDTSIPGMARVFSPVNQKASSQTSLIQNQVADFCDYFRPISDELKTSKDSLYMELQFGKLCFQAKHWENTTNPITIQGLQASLAVCGSKDAVLFDNRNRDMNSFECLRHYVLASEDKFYPYSSTTSSLSATRPHTSLVIWTEGFRIELEVYRTKSVSWGGFAKLSNMRVFQLKRVGGHIGMNVACPTHTFDWQLEALAELGTTDVPPHIEALSEKITVRYITLDDEFQVPSIRAELINSCRIKHIAVKRAWTVGCRGTAYALEMASFQERPASKSTDNISIYSTTTLRNSSWEDVLKLQHAAGKSRDLGSGLENLFPPTQTGNGVYDFLSLVQSMMDTADSADDVGKENIHNKVLNETSQNRNPVSRSAQEQFRSDLDVKADVLSFDQKQDDSLFGLLETGRAQMASNQKGPVLAGKPQASTPAGEDLILFD